MCATIATAPDSSAASATALASARLSDTGISTSTCLPARSTSTACSAWSGVGVARMTASISVLLRASPRWLAVSVIPYSAATRATASGSLPTRSPTSTSSIWRSRRGASGRLLLLLPRRLSCQISSLRCGSAIVSPHCGRLVRGSRCFGDKIVYVIVTIVSQANTVTDALRQDILNGYFPPGARLVEAVVCDRYEISRASARAAFLALSAEGLVERETNRGATVRRVSPEEAVQITEPGPCSNASSPAKPRRTQPMRTKPNSSTSARRCRPPWPRRRHALLRAQHLAAPQAR